MAPAQLAGHFAPRQQKRAEPLAGEEDLAWRLLPAHGLRSWEDKTRGLALKDG